MASLLYDGHGNMVATLSATGTSWSVANERSYDVWGAVRSGATTGGPKGRYVANLGHVQDDESLDQKIIVCSPEGWATSA